MRNCLISASIMTCLLIPSIAVQAQGSGSGSGSGSIKSPGSQAGKVTELTEIGGKVLKDWVKDLGKNDPSVRDRAMRAILQYGKVATELAGPPLMERLRDPDVGMKSKTILALGVIGVPEKDTPRFVEMLGNIVAGEPQEIVRYNAAMVLAKLGPDARPAVPKLAQAAHDALSWEVRKMCMFTLGEAARDKNGPDILAINAAMQSLTDVCAEVRMEGATALFALGQPSDEKVRANLVATLKQRFGNEKDPEVIIWLYMAVIGVDGPKDTWLKPLSAFIKDKEPLVREQALVAMGMLGDQGKSYSAQVGEALNDTEVPVVVAAINAEANIHRKDDRDKLVYRDEWLKALSRFLKHASPVVREQALTALGRYGENAKPCVGDVVDILKDPEVQVVYSAITTLARIGVISDDIIAALNAVRSREDLTGAAADELKRAAEQLVKNMKNGKKP
jgi:HEAT repeat protein